MITYFWHLSNTVFTRARTHNANKPPIKVKLNGPLSNHWITALGIPGGHQDADADADTRKENFSSPAVHVEFF